MYFCGIKLNYYWPILYYDKICVIVQTDFNKIRAYYLRHETPKPADRIWIETQIKVIARRKWGRKWVARLNHWDYFPAWDITGFMSSFKKRWRKYDKVNQTKELN